MASNKSAFVDGVGQPLRIGESAMPTPGPNDIVVKNHAFAINTIDPSQAETGFMIKQYPAVVGHDLAGEVAEVGSNVTRFKKGDRVIGHAWAFLTGQPEDGAFSLYARVPAGNAARLPDGIKYKQAVNLPLAIDTASGGLHQESHLRLDFPSVDAKPNDKVVALRLSAPLQFNSLSTLAIESSQRQAPRTSASVVKLALPMSSITKIPTSPQTLFVGLYNAIGIPQSFDVVNPIMEKLGGGIVANTEPPPEGLSKNIEVKFVLGVGDFSFPIWEHFVTPALGSGKLKCLPEPVVVGQGLESLQKAFEVRNGDVSGQKVVVEL